MYYRPIRKNLDSIDRGLLGPADGVVGDQGPVGEEVWRQRSRDRDETKPAADTHMQRPQLDPALRFVRNRSKLGVSR